MRRTWLIALSMVALLSTLAVPASYAASGPTLISSCNPTYVITQPGSYLVTQDLIAAPHTNCIDIEAANVVLDLAGHTIKRTALEGFGVGIEVFDAPAGDLPPGISGVQVTNGTIIGFAAGVNTLEAPGVILRNLTIRDSFDYAMDVQQSDGAVVEGNNATYSGSGIEVAFSNNVSVVGNSTSHNGSGAGVDFSDNIHIIRNTVEDNTDYGIILDSPSSYVSVVDNTIADNGDLGILVGSGTTNLLSPPPPAAVCSPTSFGTSSHNVLTRNKLTNNRVGIYLPCGAATNNTITNNIVTGDSIVDLYDGTLGCDANLWVRNTGTRNQNCIH